MKKYIFQLLLLSGFLFLLSGCANPDLDSVKYAARSLTDQQRIKMSESCFLAIQRGEDDAAIMTIKQGAFINWRDPDEGWTLLIAAIYFEDEDTAEFLIECGANLNLTDYNGRTPLMWAAIRGNEDLTEKLVEAGADIDARDVKKLNAIQYAIIHDAEFVAEYLLEVKSQRYRAKLKKQYEAEKKRALLKRELNKAEAQKAITKGKRIKESRKCNAKAADKKVVPAKSDMKN